MNRRVRRLVQGPLTRAAMGLGHRAILALGGTWRISYSGRSLVEEARRRPGPLLYAFTHGVLLPLAYAYRDRDARVLISESRDGEIIARITERLGFVAVRGSSSRGGRRALAEMRRLGRAGYDLGFTPDGPRGPRGSVSPGAVVAARDADLPIVPVGVAADRAWRMRSWDRFLIPKPGARVWVVFGTGLRPAEGGGPFDVEAECRRLEAALADAEALATAIARGDEVPTELSRVPA